jgi:hypothetical protein
MRISFLIRNTACIWNQHAEAANRVRRALGMTCGEGNTGGPAAPGDPWNVNTNVSAAIAVD